MTEKRPTFFDTLPYDALENVVRLLSEFPYEKWRSSLSMSDTWLVLLPGSPLEPVGQRCIQAVAVASDRAEVLEAREEKMDAFLFTSHFHLGTANAVMRAHSHRIEALCMHSYIFTGWTILEQLAEHGSSLRSLVAFMPVEYYSARSFVRLLKKRGSQLRKLEIRNDYVGQSDKQLLTLVASYCRSLEELSIGGMATPLSESFWRAVGGSLKTLSFRAPPQPEELYYVTIYCRSLCAIEILFVGIDQYLSEPMARLCVSYGAQLERATYGGFLLPEHLELCLNECPNARFDLSACPTCRGEDVPRVLKMYDRRMEFLHICVDNRLQIAAASFVLSFMRSVELHWESLEQFANVQLLLAEPMYELRDLTLSFRRYSAMFDEQEQCRTIDESFFARICKCSYELRSVKLDCVKLRKSTLCALSRSCIHMHSVRVELNVNATDDTTQDAIDIFRSLESGIGLRRIVISLSPNPLTPVDKRAIRDACFRYRNRHVSLYLEGFSVTYP